MVIILNRLVGTATKERLQRTSVTFYVNPETQTLKIPYSSGLALVLVLGIPFHHNEGKITSQSWSIKHPGRGMLVDAQNLIEIDELVTHIIFAIFSKSDAVDYLDWYDQEYLKETFRVLSSKESYDVSRRCK